MKLDSDGVFILPIQRDESRTANAVEYLVYTLCISSSKRDFLSQRVSVQTLHMNLGFFPIGAFLFLPGSGGIESRIRTGECCTVSTLGRVEKTWGTTGSFAGKNSIYMYMYICMYVFFIHSFMKIVFPFFCFSHQRGRERESPLHCTTPHRTALHMYMHM